MGVAAEHVQPLWSGLPLKLNSMPRDTALADELHCVVRAGHAGIVGVGLEGGESERKAGFVEQLRPAPTS